MNNSLLGKQATIQASDITDGSYTTSLGNYNRILTVDDFFRIQHFDNDGAVSTDGWQDMFQITWGTNTNKSIVGLPGDLLEIGLTSLYGAVSVLQGLTANSITTPSLNLTGFYPDKP